MSPLHLRGFTSLVDVSHGIDWDTAKPTHSRTIKYYYVEGHLHVLSNCLQQDSIQLG